ncbi:MAG: hypothetical protein LCH99_37175 [Proteobacteria bacterium]|nr:hypothetical protein [Pseudomonadota bacterium]
MIKLSDFIRDPFVAAAFRRAERDTGFDFAIPTPKSPVLAGGAVLEVA